MKEKLKEFIFRFRIFIWYLFTEPFRQLESVMKILNKTLTWVYVFLAFTIMSIVEGKKPVATMIFIVLILTIFLWEWESGYFMHRWRQNYKKKILEEKNDK